MLTDLQKYAINSSSISDDLFGKDGAQYELVENRNDLIIAASKIVFYFTMTFLPLLFVFASYVALSLWYFGSLFSPFIFPLLFGLVIGGCATGAIAESFFTETESDEKDSKGKRIKIKSPYKQQKANINRLWERRKNLNRFLSVETQRYNHSQAREIAPLLLARIKKHNQLIDSGARMISLQETLDRNSNTKLAPDLAEKITNKVKTEYHDLRNRLETYEVMKEMTTDMSLDITTALMDIKDLNKSDLDEFLNEQRENIALLTDDNDKNETQIV